MVPKSQQTITNTSNGVNLMKMLMASLVLLIMIYPTSVLTCNKSSVIVIEGQPTTMRFHFDPSAADRRLPYQVTKEDTIMEQVLIMKCDWLRHLAEPECPCSEGYNSDGRIRKNGDLVIKIPNTTKEHAGLYHSMMLYHRRTDTKTCSLDLQVLGNTVSCSGSHVRQGENASIPCHFNGDLSSHYDAFSIEQEGGSNSLYCNKNGTDTRKYFCHSSSGKLFEVDNVRDSFTWVIPKASTSDTGYYHCGTVPTFHGVKHQACFLSVSDAKERSLSQNVRLVISKMVNKNPEESRLDADTTTPELGSFLTQVTDTTMDTLDKAVKNPSSVVSGKKQRVGISAILVYLKTRRLSVYSYIELALVELWQMTQPLLGLFRLTRLARRHRQ